MSLAAPVTTERDELFIYLNKRGIVNEHLIGAAKLSYRSGRVLIPWLDRDGEIIYETARATTAGTTPKYLHRKGERPALFASPGAWEASRVALVEGQFDALACGQAGLSAFATSGNQLSDEAIEYLRQKDEVLFVADADEAGERLTEKVTDALKGYVRLFLVTLPEGVKDIAEVAEGADDPEELVAEVLSEAVEVEDDRFRLVPVNLAELLARDPEPVTFVHEPEIPSRRKVIAFGAAESGKSMWAAWVASKTSRQQRGVLFVSEENPLDEDIRRLRRLKPDPKYLRFVSGSGIDLALPEHRDATIEAAQGCALVLFDTLTACWSGDENDNAAVAALDREVLTPLVHLTGASVVVLDHTGHQQAFVKRGGVNAGRGASAKGQKADVVLNFVSRSTQGEFLLSVGKARGLIKPPDRVLRVVDTEDGGLDIEEVGASDSLRVAELAEEMVAAIETAGALPTNALREAVKAGKDLQTAAMTLLELESPARVQVKEELFDTGGGRQNCKVWRPVDGSGTLDV